ncbi:MAG: hypothetical protein HOD63_01645, partial [Bacteroidetes bacterium]|nr:hypothetical protein [Bacteroidota bacterium]
MKAFQITSLLIAFFLCASCAPQNLFQSNKEIGDINQQVLDSLSNVAHILSPDDKIIVSIWNHNDLSVGSIWDIYNSNEVYGRWLMIDSNGEVKLPKLGAVKLGGYNIRQAEQLLTAKYSDNLVDPLIDIKILNRTVTVLGEVIIPGNFVLEKDRNTLLELLGRAGGFDFYADKSAVKLVREVKGKPIEFSFDLTNMNEYQLYHINLKSNDVIFVPTRKG